MARHKAHRRHRRHPSGKHRRRFKLNRRSISVLERLFSEAATAEGSRGQAPWNFFLDDSRFRRAKHRRKGLRRRKGGSVLRSASTSWKHRRRRHRS